MSSDNIAIRVAALGKCYQIYDRPQDRLKQYILPKLHRVIGQVPDRYFREFWALRDVSFEVRRGETVGIIGRNGSGKSTLLQMICGTLAPTTGQVETRGRVAALLELGAGFNPDFTGRENVYLNGVLLGLTQEEIDTRFEDIAAFADIGDFIEQPIKHYSSGMYARLAFAVAINVDPDILVVDEALSVGDEPFQRKCFARIDKIKNDGATILFVSHSGGAIINLCDRAILLDRGQRLFTGSPKRAVFFSQKLGNTPIESAASVIEEIRNADAGLPQEQIVVPDKGDDDLELPLNQLVAESAFQERLERELNSDVQAFMDASLVSETASFYRENGARIECPGLYTLGNEMVNHIFRGGRYKLRCTAHFEQNCPGVRFYALIRTTEGIDLAGCAHPILGEPGIDVRAGTTLTLEFVFTCSLNPATYFCNFAIQSIDGSLHHRVVDALVFRVMADKPRPATGLFDIGFNPEVKEENCFAV
jgi:lipopolysaccharide transport system ATP-binding protein